MDTLIRELADIAEKLIPKVPEILLGFNSCADSIKGIAGCLLVLQGDGPIVDKGLQSMSIFTLKHHVQLIPAHVPVIGLILQLMGEFKLNFGASQQLTG